MDFLYSMLWKTENDKEMQAIDDKFKSIILETKTKDFVQEKEGDKKGSYFLDESADRSSKGESLIKIDLYCEKNDFQSKSKFEGENLKIKIFQSLIKNEYNKENLDSRPNKTVQFKCGKCGDMFTSESSMKNHKSIHQMEMRMVARNKNIFRCLECKKKFDQNAKLLVHRYSHSQSSSLCNICHERVDHLMIHRREVHQLEIRFTA